MIQVKTHWEAIYQRKQPDDVSWFQAHAKRSMEVIRATGLPTGSSVIDVGAGASTLVDDLLDAGWRDLTVLDVSDAALAQSRARLGARRAAQLTWLSGDIREVALPQQGYDLWHDRAVFHFLTEAADRAAYVRQVMASVKPGGHVIVASFASDGPAQCSGLPVVRYAPGQLHSEFGPAFQLLEHSDEIHHTPWGSVQHFVYCHCLKLH